MGGPIITTIEEYAQPAEVVAAPVETKEYSFTVKVNAEVGAFSQPDVLADMLKGNIINFAQLANVALTNISVTSI
jgi:hypothetical protein